MLREIAKHLPGWRYDEDEGEIVHESGEVALDIEDGVVDADSGEAEFVVRLVSWRRRAEERETIQVFNRKPQQIARDLKQLCKRATELRDELRADEEREKAEHAVREQHLEAFRRDEFDRLQHNQLMSEVSWDMGVRGERHVVFSVTTSGRLFDVRAGKLSRKQALAMANALRTVTPLRKGDATDE